MGDPGEVDGGALAAMGLLDGAVVVLDRADADPLATREPLHLVADAEATIDDGPRHDGAVTLDDERAIDRHAEPLLRRALFELGAAGGDGVAQFGQSHARDG